MKLFKYDNYRVTVSEEALTLKAFKAVWDRDKSKDKSTALKELSLLYFYCDPRSEFMYIVDDKERLEKVVQAEGLPNGWKEDRVMLEAIRLYKQMTQTTTSLLVLDTRTTIEKVRQLLKDIDLTLLDDKGKLVYSLPQIMQTIKIIPQLSRDLSEAEKQIYKEVEDNSRMQGSRVKKLFEDGLTI